MHRSRLGSLGIDTSDLPGDDIRGRKLGDVARETGAHARWYEDRDLEIGDWIFFEVKLAYRIIDENVVANYTRRGRGKAGRKSRYREDRPAAVVFVSLGNPEQLLLHGSAKHLVGHRSRASFDLDIRSFSNEPLWLPGVLGILADFVRPASLGVSSVIDLRDDSSQQLTLSSYLSDTLSTGLFRRVCGLMGPALSTAATMAGYARVTLHPGGDPRTVVATPLFVEYVHDHPGR